MGTWAEWSRFTVTAGYYSGFPYLIIWLLRLGDEDSTRQNLRLLIDCVFFGVGFGFQNTFELRIWHWPLSILTGALIVSYLVLVWLFRRQVAENWSRDWQAWREWLRRLRARPAKN